MSINLPLKAVLDYNNTTAQGAGPTSVAGGLSKTFTIPQDTDNIVVKYQTSTVGGGASATFQTTDDGGTTWFDVARTSVVSNANASVTPEWITVSTMSPGVKTVSFNINASTVAVGSVVTSGSASIGGTIGRAGASTLSAGAMSGLPILSPLGRIFIQYGSGVTSVISERVTVLVNNQSNRA